MNILVTRFPLQSAYGGAEVHTLSLMKELAERGHRISFLGSCPALLEQTEKFGILHSTLKIGPPPVTKWDAVCFFWRKKRMKKMLIEKMQNVLNTKSSTPDVILMLSLSEKILLTHWALNQGIKVFWIEHDMVGRWLTCNPWLIALKKLSKEVTTIVVSNLSKKIYLDLGWPEKNVVAIPDGVRVKQIFRHSSLCLNSGEKTPHLKIGCIARLTYDKGVDLLIETVKNITNVELHIIGRGKEEKNIKKNIQNQKHITLTSWVDDLSDFYSTLDILVLPSREHDPFGMVASEAMMYGVPVIVTDQCGIAGYLQNGTDALIIPSNSVSALKKAILRMQNEPIRQALGKEGQKTAQEKFSLQCMVDTYEKIFDSTQ